MSFVISDTSPVFTNPTSVPPPPAGTNTNAVVATATPVQLGGGVVAPKPVTDTSPVGEGGVGAAIATSTVTYTTAPAPAGAVQQVVVSGAATRVNISTGAAKVQAIGGGSIVESTQVATDTAAKTISLGDTTAPYNGVAVNSSAEVTEVVVNPVTGAATSVKTTVAQAAGNQGGPFAYYACGGFGNDTIEGSSLADFIRGGPGADSINAFAGNDLIRGGTGSDLIRGGAGADTLYYTDDQFPLNGVTDTDTFVDFLGGTDKISFDRSIVASTANIAGLGTNTITVASGSSTVRIVSQGSAITAGDINFIG